MEYVAKVAGSAPYKEAIAEFYAPGFGGHILAFSSHPSNSDACSGWKLPRAAPNIDDARQARS